MNRGHSNRHYNRHVRNYHGWNTRPYRFHRAHRRYHAPRNFYYTPSFTYISYDSYYNRYRDYRPRYAVGGYYNYHNNSVIIGDYDYYGLYEPPHGHHWVRDHDNGDAILAAVATGAIIGLVIGVLAD